jgi:hypothetical protein
MHCSRCRWTSVGEIPSRSADLPHSTRLSEAEGPSNLKTEGLHMSCEIRSPCPVNVP